MIFLLLLLIFVSLVLLAFVIAFYVLVPRYLEDIATSLRRIAETISNYEK